MGTEQEIPLATVSAKSVGTSDHLLARGRAGDVAVVDAGRSYSYGELRAAAGRLAAELAALDLPRGSHVGLVGPNSFFWVAAYLAAMKGHVAVPLPARLSPAELAQRCRLADCAAVLMDRRQPRGHVDALAGWMPVVTDDCLYDGGPACWPDDDAVDPDSDAALMFTSGTTATPRAVRVTHRNIAANTGSIISYLELCRSDRMLVVLPFSYCFGLSLLHTHLRGGGSLVVCNGFTLPETAVDMIEQERCTGLAGVPSVFQLLLRASSFASRDLPSLRHVQQAGGELAPALVDELLAARCRARVFVMYGQTEATARLSYLPPEQLGEKRGSIGRAVPGVELRVVDDHGDPVPAGVTGEIVARGDNVSPGYYKDPEATARKFPDGVLRTGDVGFADPDGHLFLVDRLDDFIKPWGLRVSSQEIESCALDLHDLVSAAAVGVPDPEAGEAVALVATVRAGSTVTPDDVLAFLRGRLDRHKLPRSVHLVDSLPLTAAGKVSKSQLRDRLRSAAPGRSP
jgi:long-chain acyl-CoA synthetase